jgi:hypothetical protein
MSGAIEIALRSMLARMWGETPHGTMDLVTT